jgi:hypothetical protein
LSQPTAREPLHRREIELHGFLRQDGLIDIEARLTDTRAYGFVLEHRGEIAPGEPLHGMWMRITLDHAMTILACEAAMDHTPYAICPAAAPNFSALAGLRIGRGFLKAAGERVGGPRGCTHLRELLQQMATVAFQTVVPARARIAASRMADAETAVPDSFGGPHALVDTCLAYAADGPVVRRKWPELSRTAPT